VALFVGDDWAEDHHDVEILDEAGRRLARAKLDEGAAGMARLHELIAEHLDDEARDPASGLLGAGQVIVGIETDRGPWVVALIAAGYEVFAINPLSVARYRERHSTSGAKSDPGDAHVLAEIVRLDRAHHRPVAGDSEQVEGLKLTARSHQSLIWDRTRQLQRLRQVLREYFPAMLAALAAGGLELGDADALELLHRAGTPQRARQLSRSKIVAVLARGRRRDREVKAEAIQAALRAAALAQPAAIETAYAAIAATQVQLITTLNTQIPALGQVVEQGFSQHPDAEIYLSQPGLGVVLGARGAGRVRRRPEPLPRRESPPQLRGHLADHPRVGAQARRVGPLRAQPSPRRRGPPMGVLRAERLTRRPRLLRRTPRSQDRPPRRAAPTRQPPRRHPARLPQDPNPLRRDHRLGPPNPSRSLTPKTMGCLRGAFRPAC
jgi:hypothetical protein